MSQIAWPIHDVTVGGWQTPDLWQKLDEQAPDDADYISTSNPSPDVFEVLLSDTIAMPFGPGPKAVKLRVRRTTSDPAWVTVQFLQGSQVIAERGFAPPESFTDVAIVLTGQQIALITDPANLRVRVSATCQVPSSSSSGGADCCDCVNYQYTMTGNSCQDLNQTIVMEKHFHNVCYWVNEVGPSLSELLLNGADYHLSIGKEGSHALYTLPAEEWDCHGCNTMELSSTQGICNGWPQTLDVCCIDP